MDAVFFCGVPVGCVMAYGLVLDATRQVRELERDRKGWGEYAARRAFRYSAATKALSLQATHRIDGRARGVAVTCSTGVGILRLPTTTLTARASVPVNGRLYVSCAEVFSRAQDDLLVRRVDVSDPSFNAGFFVMATREEAAEEVLTPAVRALLAQLGKSGRQSLNFRCDRHDVAVEWLGTEALPEMFDLGCELLAAVCDARRREGAYR